MQIIGGIAGILLFVKIILHLYLLSKVEDDFRLLDYSSPMRYKRAMVLLPSMDDVPKNYSALKTVINCLYAISICGLIVFLIWYNTSKKSS
jgi:hypothetical protein